MAGYLPDNAKTFEKSIPEGEVIVFHIQPFKYSQFNTLSYLHFPYLSSFSFTFFVHSLSGTIA